VLAPAPKLGAALPLAAARSVKKKRGRDEARCAEQGAAARTPAGRRGRDQWWDTEWIRLYWIGVSPYIR
jgi:hypothetical protein